MKTNILIMILMIVGIGMIGTVIAQPAESEVDNAPIIESPTSEQVRTTDADAAKGVFNSVKDGHWILALGFLSMLLGSIGRLALAQKWKFWESKAGGYTTAGIMGLTVLGAGIIESGLSVNVLVFTALAVLSAMGIHGPVKSFLKGPDDSRLALPSMK